MQDPEELTARVTAIERALADDDVPLTDLVDAADRTERLTELESEVDALDERVAALEAGLEAVRGYAGAIRAVNRDVERRANAALGAVDRLEDRLDGESPPRVDPEPVDEDSRGRVIRMLDAIT